MKITLRAAYLASTALLAFAQPAEAAAVALAVAATVAGGVATAALAGTAIVWSAVLGQAAVSGLLAGVSAALAPDQKRARDAREITLNRIQPVTEGLIVYGERTLGGSIIARSTTPKGKKKNFYYHSVIPLACHEIDGATEIWIGQTKVWTEAQYLADQAANELSIGYWGQIASPYRYEMFLRVYNGTEDQQADPTYVAAASEWTASARGRGIAYVFFRAFYNPDLFPRGVEPIRVRVRGKKVYDPRSGLTEYSANPALHARDYALTPESRGGIGWAAQDIDDAAIIALANVCEEQVPLDAGGTEDRYQFNGVLDTAAAPEENLSRLSTAWGGWWTCDKSLLTVGGGSYEVPAVTITEDDLVGPVRVRARRPFEDQFNVVKAVYADPEQEHTATDLPVLSSTTYRAQDNGEELVRDLGELPGEVGFARGQRLMKLALLKGRRQRGVELQCSLAMSHVSLGDTVQVTIPRRGWTEKTFEVVGRTIQVAPGAVSVGLSLIESGADIYDWTTSEETPKPAGGVPSLPSPTDKPVFDPPTIVEELYETRGGGGIKVRVTLAADSDSPFVDNWQFSYQRAGDEQVILPSSREQEIQIDDVQPGSYTFGVRGTTRGGVTGEWAFGNPTQIIGVNDVPVAVSALSVQSLGGVALLRWARHPSLDVRQGGRIEFRHSPASTGASWQTSTSIGKAVAGGQTEAALPLKSGTYLARAFDAQDIPGAVTSVVTRAASITALTQVASVTEEPGWTGAKTDCTVDVGTLSIDAGQVEAEYVLAGQIDLGAVEAVRLVAEIAVTIGRRSALFWQRGGTKFWQRGGDDFWTASGAFGDVDIQVSETDDDPAGAPVWSDYRSFDASVFEARAFRFKALITAENEDFETRITGLTVSALQEV